MYAATDLARAHHARDRTATTPRDEEEFLRASCYRLLSSLLAAPPDRPVLDVVAGLTGDDTPLGQALAMLAETAQAADPVAVAEEYHDLFIGVGRGELVPFGSYYLAGFLHEKPLAKLRRDLERLGVARAESVHEPEDHIAALCETMAGLIDGVFGAPADLDDQHRFFEVHVGSWAGRFFEDLEWAESATFYGPVGRIGRIFMEIEAAAFRMAA
jgi:TorA maturation chaperone TorD